MEAVALTILAILAGWTAGKFLTFTILVLISIVLFVMSAYFFATLEELAALGAVIFAWFAAVFGAVMWLMYYLETGQTWFGEFLKGYVLR